MSEGGGAVPRKTLTLDDLIEALDKCERVPSNIPKVNTFHFKREQVPDWLDLTEQALVGLSDEVKFQRILKYVLHSHHREVSKVVDAANGSWARFRDLMLRKYRLGDDLLTMADLEAMNKDDFSTIGAFVHEFKKKARKVYGISEETQCAIFLGLLTGTEAAQLMSHGGGSGKLTWAIIDKGVEEGSLDHVEQHQMRLQRRKREERDATASGTPGVKRIVTDVLAALGYDNEAEVQKRGVTVAQGRASGAVDEEVGLEDYGGEETDSQILTKAQTKQRNLLMGGQGSGKGQAPQAIAAPPPAATTAPAPAGPSPMGPPPTCGHWMPHCQLTPWPRNKNRADGLSRVNWDKPGQESVEDTPPVDGFLDQEEDVRLHINEWSLRVPSCASHPIWLTPKGYEQKKESVLKPFQEEDPWGGKNVGWMMKLALAGTHSLVEEVRTIEEGPTQVEEHEQLMGGMYLLTNTLLQGSFDRRGSLGPMESKILVHESQDDEFEEGEIREDFRAKEYEGIYWELGLLLSCEMRDRDASAKAQKMRHLYVVRDGHLFIKWQVGNPKRIVCGRNRQIDIITALHDGIAGGHRGIGATCAKISELYHWDGMLTMVIKYCQSCVPCQERSAQRPGEPLHPRLETEVGAVIHLDLLFMPAGENGRNYIFDARDNLTGFVDGRAIRTKTGPVLASCIEEYYLRYPFVKEFVMDRGSEFTCNEVRTLLVGYGIVANYNTAAHPQANAPVERGHSTITNLLDKWTERKPASQLGEGLAEPVRYVPMEEPLDPEAEADIRGRREPQGPEAIAEQWGLARPQVEEVIAVGDDTPSSSPAPEQTQQPWPEGIPEPDRGEIHEFPPEATTIPERGAKMEEQRVDERAGMSVTTLLPLAMRTAECPAIGGPAPVKPPPTLPSTSGGKDDETLASRGHGSRVGGASKETREEKSARVQVRLTEIHAGQAEMEAAAPTPPVDPKTSEQRIDKLWARYEGQRDAARQRSQGTGQADEKVDGLREAGDLGFCATRMAVDRVDRRIREVAVTSFDRYSLLSDELTARKLKVEHLTTRLAEEKARSQAREIEWKRRFEELAAIVDRLLAAGVARQTARAGVDGQDRGTQVSPSQETAAESPRQRRPTERVSLNLVEGEATRRIEGETIGAGTFIEMAMQPRVSPSYETRAERLIQGPQYPSTEKSGAQESLMAMSTERRGSRLHELAAAMGIGTPQERPQRPDTSEYAPRVGRDEVGMPCLLWKNR
ncbi:hypothetical protein CBR_g18563 [Chara braunii]|uniref:Integrase catalytic domain-containing protein n=1 Tax=Chara braunii TaxID=69332 RepID=A0A388JT27_CHABU|nr:hypothetical protein CBR_g18563 [Chara braunii]|eukprot:GBG60964.1 hypothetical protein CBR_g18563 [Chara braunii]